MGEKKQYPRPPNRHKPGTDAPGGEDESHCASSKWRNPAHPPPSSAAMAGGRTDGLLRGVAAGGELGGEGGPGVWRGPDPGAQAVQGRALRLCEWQSVERKNGVRGLDHITLGNSRWTQSESWNERNTLALFLFDLAFPKLSGQLNTIQPLLSTH